MGKKPNQYISRLAQTNTIIEDLTDSIPSTQLYMLTGVCGSGKTVMLSTISHELRQRPDWLVVELNPTRDLLMSLAAKLYAIPELHTLFIKARFDFSAFGLGVAIENTPPVTDIETVLELMLTKLAEHNKRLLVTIDEVTANEYVKVFASSFQIFIRRDLPLFLLMTGLFENISEIQNDRELTFLYRALKINLAPLNLNAIATSDSSRIKDIRATLDFSSSLMSVYRERLKQKGLVDTSAYGSLTLTLPRFENFIQFYREM